MSDQAAASEGAEGGAGAVAERHGDVVEQQADLCAVCFEGWGQGEDSAMGRCVDGGGGRGGRKGQGEKRKTAEAIDGRTHENPTQLQRRPAHPALPPKKKRRRERDPLLRRVRPSGAPGVLRRA